MTNPVDTLKALREREASWGCPPNELAALDAAIAALSESSHIRTVMRIEHEGRTFSVDGWAGPMVLGWRDAAMGGAATGQVPECAHEWQPDIANINWDYCPKCGVSRKHAAPREE